MPNLRSFLTKVSVSWDAAQASVDSGAAVAVRAELLLPASASSGHWASHSTGACAALNTNQSVELSA